MSTEEMIKEAFEHQAGRAPDHVRVLTAVMAKTTKRRSRPILYSLIATGVAAAVAVPVMTLGGETPETLPAGSPTASAQITSTIPPVTPGVMRYRPYQLPDKVVEMSRGWNPDGRISRTWGVGPVTKVVFRQNTGAAEQPAGTNPVRVDINGNEGTVTGDDTSPSLWWSPGHGIQFFLTIKNSSRDELIQIARSVKPGADVPISPLVEFGWLPSGLKVDNSSVQTTPEGWEAMTATIRPGKPNEIVLIAQVSSSKPGLSGTPTTIRGAQGYFGSTGSAGRVWLQLGADRWLQVSGPYGKADLVRVADTLKISDDLSFPWLGQR